MEIRMVYNLRIVALITLILMPLHTFGYNPNGYGSNSNSNSSTNAPFSSITNQPQTSSNLLKTPTLNGFGDEDLNDPNWDTIDFTNSDTGTTGWSGGGGGKGATSGKNPFGFPDEDFTPEQETATTLNGGG